MARPKLWKLNPMDFTKMNPTRQAKIEAAPAKALPATDSYVPNQLAKALHPGKQYVKVAEIVEQSADTKTFWLEANAEKGTKALAWFSAGQYLTISLQISSVKLSRSYSLSSSPREALAGRYALTVKRVKDGLASNYILDNWTVGTEVTVSEPLGVFTYEPLRDAKTVIGIAGGSGITPFRSLAKAIADGDEDAEMIVLYGSRTMADAVFQSEFKALEGPKFKLVNVLSHEQQEGCESGFITAQLIKKYAPAGTIPCSSAARRPCMTLWIRKLKRLAFGRSSSVTSCSANTSIPLRKLTIPGMWLRNLKLRFASPVRSRLLPRLPILPFSVLRRQPVLLPLPTAAVANAAGATPSWSAVRSTAPRAWMAAGKPTGSTVISIPAAASSSVIW